MVATHCGAGAGRDAGDANEEIGARSAIGAGHDRPTGAVPSLDQGLGTIVYRTHGGAEAKRGAGNARKVIVADRVGAGHD